ncbi:MAG: polysaccharide deacetylase family protein [bacterium]
MSPSRLPHILFRSAIPDRSIEIEYAIRFLLEPYSVRLTFLQPGQRAQDEGVRVLYAPVDYESNDRPDIHIAASDFWEAFRISDSPVPRWEGIPIPAGCVTPGGGWMETRSKCVCLFADVIASTFFFLARVEELNRPVVDKHGRFPASASFATREKVLDQPIVEVMGERFVKVLEQIAGPIDRRNPWSPFQAACAITHDVDSLQKYGSLPGELYRFQKGVFRGHFRAAGRRLFDFFTADRDPFDCLDRMAETQKRKNIHATFFFLVSDKTKHDAPKPFDSDFVGTRIRSLLERFEVEIGLHPSYLSSEQSELVALEKQRLEIIAGTVCQGSRQHYLRLTYPETLRHLEAAGLAYDCSLGFADAEGFRAGTCRPFRPFDPIQRRVMNLWELPLTCMDNTLFTYQQCSADSAAERIAHLAETVRRYQGILVLLFHNRIYDSPDYTPVGEAFNQTLQHIEESGVWLCDTCSNLLKTYQTISDSAHGPSV